MPGTSKPPIPAHNAILQRRTVMRTSWTEGVNFIVYFDEEDFSIFYAFDFDFDFVQGGEGW